ncbi:unnamed protein product [Schistocephalus solidus]|uniref:Mediator of RNA polymerase II transcription subunit 6 n=1 Tax=Schistocephalus solidus TaxID=70667 RepID=A0A183TAE1_SCHSO|nr:unnamed protein product [Schistocephalus solidus]
MAFTDSKSCAGLHAEGNIAGSVDLNRLISQLTVNSRSPTYLLVQNTGSLPSLIDVICPLRNMSTHEFLRPDHGQHQGYYDPNYMQFAQYPYQEPKGAQLPAFGATTHPTTYFTPSMPPQGSMGTDFDFEDEPPLLEELGVNFSHILQKVRRTILQLQAY